MLQILRPTGIFFMLILSIDRKQLLKSNWHLKSPLIESKSRQSQQFHTSLFHEFPLSYSLLFPETLSSLFP